MATVYLFVVFFLSRVLLLHSAEEERGSNCPHDFYCGQLGKMRFPFYSSNINSTCGLFKLNCSGSVQTIQLVEGGRWYEVKRVSQADDLILTDTVLRDHINSKNYCNIFDNYLTLPSSPWFSFAVNKSLSLFVCNRTQHAEFPEGFNYATCKDHRIYYGDVQNNSTQSFSSQCSGILLPVNEELRKCGSLSKCLNATFFVDVKIPPHCYGCHFSGGQCQINRQGDYECAGSRRHNMKGMMKE